MAKRFGLVLLSASLGFVGGVTPAHAGGVLASSDSNAAFAVFAARTPVGQSYAPEYPLDVLNFGGEADGQTLKTAEVGEVAAAPGTVDVSRVAHGFDVGAAVAAAEAELGTSRATGWNAPGECISSAKRWVHAGGGAWNGHTNPVANYVGAVQVPLSRAEAGDVVQYEYVASPTSWATGVHTMLITGRNDDGTFTIVQSNIPYGSGLVTKEESWLPKPPKGFRAVVWRF